MPGGKVGSGSGSGPGPGVGRTPHGTRRAAPQGSRKAPRPATGCIHAIELPALTGGRRPSHRNLREVCATASQRTGSAVSRVKLRIEEFHAYRALQPASGRVPHPARHLPPTGAIPVRHTNPVSPWIRPIIPQPTEISRRTRGDSAHHWRISLATASERCHWIEERRPSRPEGAQARAAACRIPRITGSGASSSQYTPRLRPARRASASTKGPRLSRRRKGVGSAISFRRRAEPSPGSRS